MLNVVCNVMTLIVIRQNVVMLIIIMLSAVMLIFKGFRLDLWLVGAPQGAPLARLLKS